MLRKQRAAERRRLADEQRRLKQALIRRRQAVALENATPSGEPHIKRHAQIDEAASYWEARFKRGGNRYAQCFTDIAHGGKAAALNAAKGWRDRTQASLRAATKMPAVTRTPRHIDADGTVRAPGAAKQQARAGTDVVPDSPRYDGPRVLDAALRELGLANDYALSQALGMKPAIISKLRYRRLPLDQAMLERIHDATGIPMGILTQTA